MNQYRPFRAAIAVAIATTVGGCVSVDFKEPVSSYSSTMALSNATLREYYTQLNSYERTIYLDKMLYLPTERVGEIDLKGARTGLVSQFSPVQIQTRLEAINLLTVYGERLGALAGSDAPQRFNLGAQTLGTNLQTLSASFQSLDSAGDPTANKYVQPVATIFGLLGEMYLDKKRDEALTQAVLEGEKPVNEILDALEIDIRTMIEPLRATGALQQLSGAVLDYNLKAEDCRKDKTGKVCLSLEQRQTKLKRIESLAAAYETSITNEPSDVIDGIRDAHAALVDYAKSPRKPTDLASLVAALELFNNRIRPIAEAISAARKTDQ